MALPDKKIVFRVLYVDDDIHISATTKNNLLRKKKFEIHCVTSVAEALKKLEKQTYDVVVSEYEISQENGLDFLKELREKKNEIPFVFFTSKQREVVVEALKIGADRCISKSGPPEIVYFELADAIIKEAEHKKAEYSLKENEEKYRLIVELAHDGVVVLDSNLTIIFVNPRMAETTGFSEEEMVGKSLFCFIPERGYAHASYYLNYGKEGVDGEFELELIRKDGQTISVLFSSSSIKDEAGNFVGNLTMVSDITARKKMEEKLKQERENLEDITENIGAGLTLISKDYRILWANKFLKQLNGPIENKTCYSTFNTLNSICAECGPQKVFNGASRDSREYFNQELFEKGLPCWFEIIATPVKDNSGTIVSVLELTIDITEKKRLESKLLEYSQKLEKLVNERTEQLHQTQAKLVSSERLAAIGELAGMVGHDLRNPLAGIKNAAYFMERKGMTISEVQSKEMLGMITKGINHADKIISDLLEYSREMHFDLIKYSTRTLVNEALKTIQIPDRINIVNHIEEESWIWVDPGRMMRVFVNLAKNAIDAMPEKGTLDISSCQTNDTMKIDFTDTGKGIPEETLSKLFTPLVTTKAQGMGFGLAICKRIVEAHGGTIAVKTELNKGTTFTLKLPLK